MVMASSLLSSAWRCFLCARGPPVMHNHWQQLSEELLGELYYLPVFCPIDFMSAALKKKKKQPACTGVADKVSHLSTEELSYVCLSAFQALCFLCAITCI